MHGDERALSEVYVVNLNTQSHAHTNELGMFTIDQTTNGHRLQIGKLGFKTVVVTVEVSTEPLVVRLEEASIQLNEVVVRSGIQTTPTFTKIDVLTNPVNSSQEILRKVPGLFIGQHAGGGKAEQLFLRGFDVDHGTDVALSVDGMPINMVSHAHGQGYSDLHFIIPETVDKIDFGKGPYQANQGNFATAGYVRFQTKEQLESSSVSFEAGQFNTMRWVGLFSILENNPKQNAYLATEYILTDGPFESPQNFNRINLFGKYSVQPDPSSKITLQASRFSSRWDASGQIPNRLVANGTISRFGAVDDTEGGTTARTHLILSHQKSFDDSGFVKSTVFYSNYDFTLFSNFTFFLNDPINGDQIKQKETRNVYGASTEWNQKVFLPNKVLSLQSGLGFRADAVEGSELSHTVNRQEVLENIQLGNIQESNVYGYINTELQIQKLKIAPAIRLDYFTFNYQDALASQYETLQTTAFKVSPKLQVSYSQSSTHELFIKSGLGFHTNDSRVVLQESNEVVPSVFGVDVGNVWKPLKNLIVHSALWSLYSEQEFVYVGDEGIVEPSGASKRYGFDFGFRYQIGNYLFLDFDGNYAFARSGPDFEDYIPLAPKWSSTGGITLKAYKGFSSSIKYRYLGDRAANETNTIVAQGYFVTDCSVNYTFKKFNVGVILENILNTEWNETQFLTTSRLQNEPQPVEEIHFTPGTPFFFKFKIGYLF
jgi:TonB-dependent Receptor Plug Domain/CarboxypepD_reg-like domain